MSKLFGLRAYVFAVAAVMAVSGAPNASAEASEGRVKRPQAVRGIDDGPQRDHPVRQLLRFVVKQLSNDLTGPRP